MQANRQSMHQICMRLEEEDNKMTYFTVYLVGFILTLVVVCFDMLSRQNLNFAVAWCVALIWPVSVVAVIFLQLFNYLKILELQGEVQEWYDKHIMKCKAKKRRKTDGN